MGRVNYALQSWIIAAVLGIATTTGAYAQSIEGIWQLVKRELPDGTVQTPPTVVGLGTFASGQRHLNVFWRTPEGNPASIGVISRIAVTSTEYTETLIALAYDDGSGKPVVYDFSGSTKSAVISRNGSRVAFKLPFDPPSVVFDGDRLTATLPGEFVDYWVRVK